MSTEDSNMVRFVHQCTSMVNISTIILR